MRVRVLSLIRPGRVLQVAVFGEGKNGKSTALNAILGEQILPSASTTCTGNITVIRGLSDQTPGRPPVARLHRSITDWIVDIPGAKIPSGENRDKLKYRKSQTMDDKDEGGPRIGDQVSAMHQTKDWVQVAVADGECRWLPKSFLKPVGEIRQNDEVVDLDTRADMPLVREEWVTRDGAFQDVEYVSVEHGHEILQDGVAIWDVPGWVQHSLSSSSLHLV
jgi:hypothetical protein